MFDVLELASAPKFVVDDQDLEEVLPLGVRHVGGDDDRGVVEAPLLSLGVAAEDLVALSELGDHKFGPFSGGRVFTAEDAHHVFKHEAVSDLGFSGHPGAHVSEEAAVELVTDKGPVLSRDREPLLGPGVDVEEVGVVLARSFDPLRIARTAGLLNACVRHLGGQFLDGVVGDVPDDYPGVHDLDGVRVGRGFHDLDGFVLGRVWVGCGFVKLLGRWFRDRRRRGGFGGFPGR